MNINKDEIYNEICERLCRLNREDALKLIGKILDREYDLRMQGKLVENDCEILLDKMLLEGNYYGEGNEEAGFISLSTILEGAEQIINCDDYNGGDIEFTHFVRPETPEEIEENGHDNNVEWFTEDESVKIYNLNIQFEEE